MSKKEKEPRATTDDLGAYIHARINHRTFTSVHVQDEYYTIMHSVDDDPNNLIVVLDNDQRFRVSITAI